MPAASNHHLKGCMSLFSLHDHGAADAWSEGQADAQSVGTNDSLFDSTHVASKDK